LPIIDSNYVVLHLAIPFVSLTLRFSQKWWKWIDTTC
jgi:hypothetical protein